MSLLAPIVTSLCYPIMCAQSAGPTRAEQFLRQKRADMKIAVDSTHGGSAPEAIVQGTVEFVGI